MMRGKHILLALIVVGTIARFVFVLTHNPLDYLFSDPKRHWDNALHFFHPSLMNGCDPILYQIYLLLVQTITDGSRIGVGALTGLLSAIMPWTFYRAGREMGLNETSALVYWALMAWIPSFFGIYHFFMMETLLLPMIGLSLWMTGRTVRKMDNESFITMTACWTLASLTKPQAIPMALICWVFVAAKMGWRPTPVCASLILMGAMLLPNAIRSQSILGYSAPLGSGYIAQIMHRAGTKHSRFHWANGTWIYSSPSCYIQPLWPLNQWMIGRAYADDIHEVTIDRTKGRDDWEAALGAVPRSIGDWLQGLGENVVLFLFAPSWPDAGRNTWLGDFNYWSRWLWAPVLFQVIVGNTFLFRDRLFPLLPILTTSVTILFLFQNSVTMEGRYRKPLEPLLLLNLVWLWSGAAPQRREDGHVC